MQNNMSALRPVRGITRAISVSRPPGSVEGRRTKLLEQAIASDRHYGPALALAASCHMQFVNYSWAEDPQAARRNSVDLARRALQVARDDPGVMPAQP
jgi:hypothetical protein